MGSYVSCELSEAFHDYLNLAEDFIVLRGRKTHKSVELVIWNLRFASKT